MNSLLRFHLDESGATAIEYAVIATLIAVAIIGSVTLAGESVQALWGDISSKVALALGSVS